MERESFHKKLISSLREAMYDFSESEVLNQLDKLFQQECVVRLCHPLGEIVGAENDDAAAPQSRTLPTVIDLSRPDSQGSLGSDQPVDGQVKAPEAKRSKPETGRKSKIEGQARRGYEIGREVDSIIREKFGDDSWWSQPSLFTALAFDSQDPKLVTQAVDVLYNAMKRAANNGLTFDKDLAIAVVELRRELTS